MRMAVAAVYRRRSRRHSPPGDTVSGAPPPPWLRGEPQLHEGWIVSLPQSAAGRTREQGAGRAPGSVRLPGSFGRRPDGKHMIAWADAGLTAPEGTAAVIKVFILDDHELVRRGLQELLEGEGFQVV